MALCSPTRSALLTGRNHTLNGMAAITETSNGFPGWAGRIPPQAATVAQVLQDNGYSTFWLGAIVTSLFGCDDCVARLFGEF